MYETVVTHAVNYYDPDRMNQPEVTRHFASEHEAREFIQNLDRQAPAAHSVKIIKITIKKEGIPL